MSPLSSGNRLGPYEIVAPLGAGGMGEVYRAKDTRLGREVAVKVLPAEIANDADRLQRFEREARAASALNHPAVLTVHDFGSEGEQAYLVTELLSGDSLRALVRKGPLAPRRAIELTLQIARGLAAAHEKGIVHRDLKPENLFLTDTGAAKILDFGLARMDRRELSAANLQDASTVLETSAGTVLGTVGYMSPEQVRGERVDARSDLFSLGVVLHELLTGANPLRRGTVVESLHAILADEVPELDAAATGGREALARLVARLLEKDPARRFHSAHDLAFALEQLAEPRGEPAREAATRSSAMHRLALPLGGLALVAAGLAAGRLLGPSGAAAPRQPVRFELSPPAGGRIGSGEPETHDLALAPDGTALVYAASQHGAAALYLREFASAEPRVLSGTEGAYSPFWSPDGRAIAFFASGKLKRVPREGGPVQVICDVEGVNTGSWGSAGEIVFSTLSSAARGIFRVPAAGGLPQRLDLEVNLPRWIELLPDGRRFLYWDRTLEDRPSGSVRLADLATGRATVLVEDSSQARYAEPGWLLRLRSGVLVAQRFDAAAGRLSGEPVALASGVANFFTGWSPFSVAGERALAYQAYLPPAQLLWIDRHGRELGRVGPEARYLAVRLSPDETTAVAARADPASGLTDLWLVDLERGGTSRLTDEPRLEWSPAWSPDGKLVAYTEGGTGKGFTVKFRNAADGSVAGALPSAESFRWVRGWGARGLLLDQMEGRESFDIWQWPMSGGEPRPIVKTEFDETLASPSPDGSWIAFLTNESGKREIYLASSEPPQRRIRVSAGAAAAVPRWRADGRELFYLSAEGWLTAVEITPGATPRFGDPQPLFRLDLAQPDGFDVVADGQRFLVSATQPDGALPIQVVLDWRAALPGD